MGEVAKKTTVYSSRTLAQPAGGEKEFGDKEEPPNGRRCKPCLPTKIYNLKCSGSSIVELQRVKG